MIWFAFMLAAPQAALVSKRREVKSAFLHDSVGYFVINRFPERITQSSLQLKNHVLLWVTALDALQIMTHFVIQVPSSCFLIVLKKKGNYYLKYLLFQVISHRFEKSFKVVNSFGLFQCHCPFSQGETIAQLRISSMYNSNIFVNSSESIFSLF